MVRLVMKPSIKAGLILTIVFLIGGLAGFITAKRVDDRPARFLGPRLDPFRQEEGINEHIENRLTKIYKFTEEQRLAMRTILEDAQRKYDDLYRETRPALDQIRRVQQAAIREMMTEEQQERFDRWMAERRKHWEGRGDRPPREGETEGSRPPKGGAPRPQ